MKHQPTSLGKFVVRAALFGAGCVAYGTFVESRSFRLRRVTVPVLPAGAAPLRVLHLSDAHLLVRNRARTRFIASLAGVEPDLVVNTGDNVAESAAIGVLADALGRLLELPGVFVMGSNDYCGPRFANPLSYLTHPTGRVESAAKVALPTQRLKRALARGGWVDLTGQQTQITVRGVRLDLRGTDDAHLGLDNYQAVSGAADSDADLVIGVTHAPYRRVLDSMTEDGVKLILAGHTHGGQVCLPGYGALTTNCDLPTAQAKGLSRHQTPHGSSWLHVSAGLGMSPTAPYRFACPPEASLVTLVPVR